MRRKISVAIVLALLWGCTSPSQDPQGSSWSRCTDPRPQICTREYDPVCARRSDGSWHTLSTGCTACSDEEVEGFRREACESDA